jgi:hypothetical protein
VRPSSRSAGWQDRLGRLGLEGNTHHHGGTRVENYVRGTGVQLSSAGCSRGRRTWLVGSPHRLRVQCHSGGAGECEYTHGCPLQGVGLSLGVVADGLAQVHCLTGDPSLAHRDKHLVQRQIRLLRDQGEQPIRVLLKWRSASSARYGRGTSVIVPALQPFDRRAGADLKMLGSLAPRSTTLNSCDDSLTISAEYELGIA